MFTQSVTHMMTTTERDYRK